jgi:hypothetical protein
MEIAHIDIWITALFGAGVAQLCWLAVMLRRRGMAPRTIWQSMAPLFSVWALMWPLYQNATWLWAGIGILLVLLLLAHSLKRPFWLHLRQAWSAPVQGSNTMHMWPPLSLIAALAVAAAFFQPIPEFGFSLALAACLLFPLADLLDRIRYLRLGFPVHPEQTLLGHLGLMFFAAILCAWSLHLYHGIDWHQLVIATLLAGIGASIARALLPHGWNLPGAVLAMGLILWLL